MTMFMAIRHHRGQYHLGLALIATWISNYIHYNVLDEISYPSPNSNGAIVAVWEWICNFTHILLACNYLSMLGSKLIFFSKMCPMWKFNTTISAIQNVPQGCTNTFGYTLKEKLIFVTFLILVLQYYGRTCGWYYRWRYWDRIEGSPGHQLPWYWPCSISVFLSFTWRTSTTYAICILVCFIK